MCPKSIKKLNGDSLDEAGASCEHSVTNSPRRQAGEHNEGSPKNGYVEGFANTLDADHINLQDGHQTLQHNASKFSNG